MVQCFRSYMEGELMPTVQQQMALLGTVRDRHPSKELGMSVPQDVQLHVWLCATS